MARDRRRRWRPITQSFEPDDTGLPDGCQGAGSERLAHGTSSTAISARGRLAARLARPGALLILVGLALLAVGCGPLAAPVGGVAAAREASDPTLVVFAATSLAEPFAEIGAQFERERPGVRVAFSFAGSQQLRAQIAQGAPADVFASADEAQIDRARAAGLVVPETPIFARNRLVVVTPASGSARVVELADLARPGLKVVLAQSEVPAGAYAREALSRLAADPRYGRDFAERVAANVVSEESNVKQVLAKVQLAEADAGWVYATDVTPAALAGPRAVRTVEVPDRYNVLASYPIGVVAGTRQPELARAFVAYVLSEPGQTALRRHGFLPVDGPATSPGGRP